MATLSLLQSFSICADLRCYLTSAEDGAPCGRFPREIIVRRFVINKSPKTGALLISSTLFRPPIGKRIDGASLSAASARSPNRKAFSSAAAMALRRVAMQDVTPHPTSRQTVTRHIRIQV